jgi:cell wall-associated NlpC family hydrolase
MLRRMIRQAPVLLRTVLVALAMTAASAQAAPDGSDLVAKLLVERGLVDAHVFEPGHSVATNAASLGQQMRNATSDLVGSAMNFLGVPYKRGGNSADTGFDCSGFTRVVYENSLGLLLPRKVDDQAKASGLAVVKRTELKPGDLVFFNTLKRTFSHVGIYVGDDKFIHAPRSGAEVRVESLGVKYWAKRFTGARRAPQATEAVVAPQPEPMSTAPTASSATVFAGDTFTP